MEVYMPYLFYSLRTLCRALRYTASNPYQAVQRSLYEAFSMSFLTQLDRASHPAVTILIIHHILGKGKYPAAHRSVSYPIRRNFS